MNVAPCKKQRGITLVELLLALAVILAVVVVGTLMYAQANTSSQAYSAQNSILTLRGTIGTMRKNGYAGLTPMAVINTGKAPRGMINGSDLISPWGKPVAVVPVALNGVPDAGFMMTFTDMPKQICPDILGILVDQFEAMRIEGQTIKDLSVEPEVPDQGMDAIIDACQSEDLVDVELVST